MPDADDSNLQAALQGDGVYFLTVWARLYDGGLRERRATLSGLRAGIVSSSC